MKKAACLCFVFLCVSFSVPSESGNTPTAAGTGPETLPAAPQVPAALSFAEIPLYFMPNVGQFDERASFCARASAYTLWATPEGLVFDCVRAKGDRGPREADRFAAIHPRPSASEAEREVARLLFLDANAKPLVTGGEPSDHRVNLFLGNDPARWREDVATYSGILYRELYPGIDLKVYGIEKQVEYDWIVGPGADPGRVRFAYEDVKGTKIDPDGNLVVTTRLGDLVHRKPVAYQAVDGARRTVAARFKEMEPGIFGFEVGSYDPGRELVIDPVVLVYATFLGGSDMEYCGGIAVDADRCVYVSGRTYSSAFPVKGAQNAAYSGDGDVFVTKFNAAGRGLVYSTIVGGPNMDWAYCLTLDKSKNAYLGGFAYDGFPTMNAYDDDYDSSLDGDYFDAIVVKLNALGKLAYSTYLGKGDDDVVYAIAVDGAGRIHVGGETDNADFPLQYAFQSRYGGNHDAFITVFSAAGNVLETSTFLGGNYPDGVTGLVLDEKGHVYVTGSTWSSDFPTKNAFDATFNGKSDAFFAKLDVRARTCFFATYLGGSQVDRGSGIAVDALHAAYLTGETDSPNFPKVNAYDRTHNGYNDVFVAKFAPNGKSLAYSTYVGGASADNGRAIVVSDDRSAVVAGSTESTEFPTLNAYDDGFSGSRDAFLLKLSPTGKKMGFSTFLGGSGSDCAYALSRDQLGNFYVAGETDSTDFPVLKGYDMTFNGGDKDLFVAKLK
jgi:hypothetical protein